MDKFNHWLWFFFLSIYVIENKESMPQLLIKIPAFVYSAFGGTLIGAAWGNWNGSKELKLLRKFKAYYENKSRST